jgi:hypothetical protein
MSHDLVSWRTTWHVDKFDASDLTMSRKLDIPEPRVQLADIKAAGIKPYEEVNGEHNLLLNAGITRILNLLIGAGGTAFNNANTRVGVGNSSTAEAAGQTDLQAAAGSSNRYFNMADASNPSVSGQTMTVVSTFASANGNFTWSEWGIDNGSTAGTTVTAPLLNRRVAAMGTKTSGATWALTVTITLA